ncbi:hypothetical protein PCANB_002023 [Pneumocystis canis]|nr:hypothetical protein PCANB_002023 [Pneumocystis canis]
MDFISSKKCPLSYLSIFNPSLGLSENSLHDQILLFISETLFSLDDQLRNIGFIQGIMQFSKNFEENKSNQYIHSKNHIIIIIHVENGWHIVAVGITLYLISINSQKNGRDVLKNQLNEWWSKWIWNLDITLNNPSILYNAINMILVTPDSHLKEKLNKNIIELKENNDRILDLIILTVSSPITTYYDKHYQGCLYAGDGTISKNNIKILYDWLNCQIDEFIAKTDEKKDIIQYNSKNNIIKDKDRKKKTTLLTPDSYINISDTSSKLASLWTPKNMFSLSSISTSINNFISLISEAKYSFSSKNSLSSNNHNTRNNIFKNNNSLGSFIYGLIEKHDTDSIISEKKLYIQDNQVYQDNIDFTLNDIQLIKNTDFKTLDLNTEINSQYISISVYYSYPFVYMILLKNQNINNSEKLFIKNNIFYINLQCYLERMTIELKSYFINYSKDYPSFFWHMIFDSHTQEFYNNIPYLNENSEKNEIQTEESLSLQELSDIHCYVIKIFDEIKNTENENKLQEYILKTSLKFWICYLHDNGKHIVLIMKKNKENYINDSFEYIFIEAKKYVSKLFYT